MKTKLLIVKILLCCFLSTVFTVSAADKAPRWEQLNSTQQSALKKLAPAWNKLPEKKRLSIVRGLSQWKAMNKQQRSKSKQRFKKWNALNTVQKNKLRKEFLAFQALTPQQKNKLRANYRRFLNLPKAQKELLKRRFALDKANGSLRRALARVIDMRHCPNLIFAYDNSISEGARMSALIDKALNKD